jgi:hypothetical protein
MDDRRSDSEGGRRVTGRGFSLKRFLVSATLIAVACECVAVIVNGTVRNPFGLSGAILFWLGTGAIFGAGIFNLFRMAFLGVLIGVCVAYISLMFGVLMR